MDEFIKPIPESELPGNYQYQWQYDSEHSLVLRDSLNVAPIYVGHTYYAPMFDGSKLSLKVVRISPPEKGVYISLYYVPPTHEDFILIDSHACRILDMPSVTKRIMLNAIEGGYAPLLGSLYSREKSRL